ncbi:MAG: EF-hand domain-containing protein [Planctomycetaceae bacterium]|nr:EF-hand domain-containing protein [Planctomycetaceae bacterium]
MFLAAFVSVSAMADEVPAQRSPQTAAALFSSLDRDRDGVVRANEISVQQQPFFRRALRVADANEDGALSGEELRQALTDPQPIAAAAAQRNAFNLQMLDRNQDGNLSRDEVPAPLKSRLDRVFDTLGTDTVPLARLQQLAGPGQQNRPQAGAQPKLRTESASQTRNPSEFFQRLDGDGNGRLTRDEVPERLRQSFRQADRDNNGSLSLDEFQRAAERLRN